MMINKNIVPDEKLTKEIKQTFFVCKRYETKSTPSWCSHSSVYIPYVLAKKFAVSYILLLNRLSYVVDFRKTFLERVVYCFISQKQFVVVIIKLFYEGKLVAMLFQKWMINNSSNWKEEVINHNYKVGIQPYSTIIGN